jgi:acetyl esterase/lipase
VATTRGSCAVALLALACGTASERLNISYDDRFGARTTMDVYLPATTAATPAVMLVHGGGWHEGSKEQLGGLARRLAEDGYAAATINYRVGSEGAYPLAPQDVRCALAFLRANAVELNLLPNRVAVFGYSAGGHLVSLMTLGRSVAATVPDCAAGDTTPPDAVVAAAAPQDLVDLSWAGEAQNFLGGTLAEFPARYQEASPLNHVTSGAPPFLLIHGTMDAVVPAAHASRMRDSLLGAGNEAQLLLLRGGGHLFNRGVTADQLLWEEYAVDAPEAWMAVTDFLRETVGQ